MAGIKLVGKGESINGPFRILADGEQGEKAWTLFDIIVDGRTKKGDHASAYLRLSYSEFIGLMIQIKPFLDDNQRAQLAHTFEADVKSGLAGGEAPF